MQRAPTSQSLKLKIWAAGTGNFLEWYDFGIYGFFAASIGTHFFPSDDPLASLLSAFGILAIGYFARPIGGFVLGRLADTLGRTPVMVIALAIMGASTFSIGLLPGYDAIGVAAPILLVILRLAQGFGVAGEYAISTVFLIENAPRNRRAFISSWSLFGTYVGMAAAAGVGAVAAITLTDAQMQDWGWRIPFLLSIIPSFAGYMLRRGLDESPAMDEKAPEKDLPAMKVLQVAWRPIVQYISLFMVATVAYYIAFVYSASDLELELHLTTAETLNVSTLSQLFLMFLYPLAGLAADRIGRKPMAMMAALGLLFFSWPFWWLMHQPNLGLILIGQYMFGAMLALGYPVYTLMMAEALPVHLRCSVLSIGSGIGAGVVGGMAPLAATFMVDKTGNDLSPAYLIMGAAAISLIATLRFRETMPERVLQTT
ncbi:MAG: MHS family MFS transporter [Hyphomicrobiales bacterium]|nr:MHS family MFS transporter [Hyphomicrobiales bacterium]